MKTYKLLVQPETGSACVVLQWEGVMVRSTWLSPERIAAIEKDPLKMTELDYPPENRVTEEFLGRFVVQALAVLGNGSPSPRNRVM